jgi:membrane-bound metal-dependent hydrolase YbcI (DUF457 family)
VALAAAPADQARQNHTAQVGHEGNRLIRGEWTYVIWCVVAACLPDIDFAWGRHNMETHSIGFALLVALAGFAWARDSRLAIACGLSAGTHVLFDWLGSDDSPPLGVMALWPWNSTFYFAAAFVFEAISRRYWLPGFVEHNVMALVREALFLGPIAVAVYVARFRRLIVG